MQDDQIIPAGGPLSFGARVRNNARATLRLALPAMGSRAGMLLLLTVDTVMVGHIGQDQLAYQIVGVTIQSVMTLIAIGFLQGTLVLISQAYGAREYPFCGEVWRVALIIAATIGIVSLVVSFFGEPFFSSLGQSREMAEGAGAVLLQYGWGMPATMLYVACAYLLEGLQRPRVAMVIMLSSVFVNVGLNSVVLYVFDGGATEAVAMTSVTRWLNVAVIFFYITRVMHDRTEFGIRMPRLPTRESALAVWRYVRRALKLGLPMGATQGAETTAFAALTLIAATLGEAAAAAHGVTMQLVQVVFMLAIGMSAATSVRAGFAVGARDRWGVAWAGWTGASLILLIMLPFGVLFFLFPLFSGMIFTTAPETLAIAAITIQIAAFMLIFDSVMTLMIGALRGAGDVIVPMSLHILSMWGIMVPAAWVLGIHMNYGVPGLFIGMFIGIGIAAIVATTRFAFVSRREIARA